MKPHRKRYLACIVALAAMVGLAPAVSSAATYTGKIVAIQTHASPNNSGNVRVSINVSATYGSPCTAYGGVWFSYDLPDNAVSKSWLGVLLAALHADRSVVIYGTGTCDSYGIETVSVIAAV